MSETRESTVTNNEPITDEQFLEMIKDENHDISVSEVEFTGSLIDQLERYYKGEAL
ncbi:MAG: hypothetical protein KDK41_11850 [Leptospiraceae bacterium]|nr:hypothetical protein [Leptospiraceae bacterium]